MKQLVDFLPIIVFVGAYVYSDIFVATAALMVAAAVQLGYFKLRRLAISRQMWVVFWVALGSGTLTLVFQDKTFIQWKPTIVYAIMAVALIGSRYVGRGNHIEQAFGKVLTLPQSAWAHLTWGWAGAMIAAGALNLYVAYGFSEQAWVTYKLVSAFAIPIVLTLASAGYLAVTGQLPTEEPPDEGAGNEVESP